MKLISELELKKLLADSELLARLEAYGVYEWNFYREALEENESFGKSYNDWLQVDLDGLLDEYESLEHYIEFNY